jgi:hypothetical protein
MVDLLYTTYPSVVEITSFPLFSALKLFVWVAVGSCESNSELKILGNWNADL